MWVKYQEMKNSGKHPLIIFKSKKKTPGKFKIISEYLKKFIKLKVRLIVKNLSNTKKEHNKLKIWFLMALNASLYYKQLEKVPFPLQGKLKREKRERLSCLQKWFIQRQQQWNWKILYKICLLKHRQKKWRNYKGQWMMLWLMRMSIVQSR